jgi:hypothetical protein
MTISIRLLRRHTHAGKEFEPDDLIAIDKDQAEWLVNAGIGQFLPDALDESTDSQPEPVAETGSSLPTREKRR